MATSLARLADQTKSSPYFALAAGFRTIAKHRRVDFVEVMVVLHGTGILTVFGESETTELELSAGTMYLYRPRDTVEFNSATRGPIRVVVITFPVVEWAEFASMVGLGDRWDEPSLPPFAAFDPSRIKQVRFVLTAMHRYEEGPTRLDLIRFWTSIVPRFFPVPRGSWGGTGAPTWLTDAVAAMRQEENMREGVARLVQLAHVSAPHLSATVRRYYRSTPTDLIGRIRLRHAAFLLRSSPDTVAEVARRTGFRNAGHFSTRFRQEFRVSPREYRALSLKEYEGVVLPDSPEVLPG